MVLDGGWSHKHDVTGMKHCQILSNQDRFHVSVRLLLYLFNDTHFYFLEWNNIQIKPSRVILTTLFECFLDCNLKETSKFFNTMKIYDKIIVITLSFHLPSVTNTDVPVSLSTHPFWYLLPIRLIIVYLSLQSIESSLHARCDHIIR